MLTVTTVLKSGGPIYDALWVKRLQAGVAKHLPIEHRFLCLSDVEVPCERLELTRNWTGWWSKVELFSLKGPILFFDLDTVIVGDLSDIAAHAMQTPFTMLEDFYIPRNRGSGMMAWAGSDPMMLFTHATEFGDRFMTVVRGGTGDQAYISETYRGGPMECWQNVVGDQIVSYKIHCRDGIPPNARVVCLHGKPKFEGMSATDPVRVAWEAGGTLDNVIEGYTFKRGLLWPEEDDATRAQLHLTISDIEVVYQHCRDFRVVVQAGGNCGLWPEKLGKRFETVYTFEPDPVNFRCLCANAPAENIYKFNAALGDKHGGVDLVRDPKRVGAHYVQGAGPIPTMLVDDLKLDVCDLVYLDIEGDELPALRGAAEMIARCRPTVVVEDKKLHVRPEVVVGAAVEYLQREFSYTVAERVHRDVILVPSE